MDADPNAFARLLQELTGRVELWEGFDPSKILETDTSGSSAALGSIEDLPDEEVPTSGENVELIEGSNWELESTGSADIIFGKHHTIGVHTKTTQTVSGDPTLPQSVEQMEKVNWAFPALEIGETSPIGVMFCPWKLVLDYPELFVGKRNAARIAPFFTLAGLHRNRVWDLYYIYDPARPKNDPVLFVPTYQFQHLLDVVNAKLGIYLTIPDGSSNQRFNMAFGHGGTPRPRFLGRSTSEDDFLDMGEDFPPPHREDDLSKLSIENREKFTELIASIFRTEKKAKKAERSRIKRIKNHIAWGRSIKRTQRYLGLRERAPEEAQAALDLSEPTTLSPEGYVLFVAIDIEAYEFNQNLVTEVGIAMLNTDKLAGIAPGEGGKNWFPLIEARHLLIKENSWAKNSKHVRGCPDRFNFGTSEFVGHQEVPKMLEQIINEATRDDNGAKVERSVVLVFHESAADIKFLKTIGYNVHFALNVNEIVDTREMNQYNTRNNNQTGLEAILNRLQIPCSYLHNGGNDAVYTLQAMISLAVERRLQSLKNRGQKRGTPAPWGEAQGWTSGEDSDGGEPARQPPDFEGLPLDYFARNK